MISLALLALLKVTPETFAATVAKPHPADIINLAPGKYGIGVLKYGEEHITGPRTAIFRSLTILGGASGSTVDGIACEMAPDAKTFSFTACVKAAGTPNSRVKGVTLSNIAVVCGKAVSGIPANSDPHLKGTQDAWHKTFGGNILGLPTGVGVVATYTDGFTLRASNISNCDKGVGVDRSTAPTIGGDKPEDGNEIHHVRTSMIVGSANTGMTISHNRLHDSNPWNPRNDGTADHADFIHQWTLAGWGPVDRLTISSNLLDQGQGKSAIGIHIDDEKTGLGFTNLKVISNTIIDADTQGIRLEDVKPGGLVADNTLLQPPGPGHAPQIIICTNPIYCFPSVVTLRGNRTGGGVQAPAVLAAARAAAMAVKPGLAPTR